MWVNIWKLVRLGLPTPPHCCRPGAVLSWIRHSASHLAIWPGISAFQALIHSWSRPIFNVAVSFVYTGGLCNTFPLSDSVFTTSPSLTKTKRKENLNFNLGKSFVQAPSAIVPHPIPPSFQLFLWGEMQWSMAVVGAFQLLPYSIIVNE